METGVGCGGAATGGALWWGDCNGCEIVSADGRRVLSGSGDRTVRIWDMETGVDSSTAC